MTEDEAILPEGWTLERLREVGQSPTVQLLPSSTPVFFFQDPPGSPEPVTHALEPEVIIDFRYRVLVRAVRDPEWYMGEFNDEGAVMCWGAYGSDLLRAIRAM